MFTYYEISFLAGILIGVVFMGIHMRKVYNINSGIEDTRRKIKNAVILRENESLEIQNWALKVENILLKSKIEIFKNSK